MTEGDDPRLKSVAELGGALYAFDAAQVESMSPTVPFVPLPLAPPSVEGIAHVAGRIIPVVRLHSLVAPEDPVSSPVSSFDGDLIVVRAPAARFALLVDRVLAAAERIDAASGSATAAGAVVGTGTWRGR
ncbi:MAG: chemotaxis protein CheW, partial [Stellaceae bacterium]